MSKAKEKLFSVTLDDCRVDTFRSGGPGGQHQNKTESGVRITHIASGAIGESRELREQHKNKVLAFRRMAESKTFQLWAKIRVSELLTGKSIDDIVDEQMHPSNLKVEERDENGKWIEING